MSVDRSVLTTENLVHEGCNPEGDDYIPYIDAYVLDPQTDKVEKEVFVRNIFAMERVDPERFGKPKTRPTDALRLAFAEENMTLEDATQYRVMVAWRAYRFFCESLGLLNHAQLLSDGVDDETFNAVYLLKDATNLDWRQPPTATHKAFLDFVTKAAVQNPTINFSLNPRKLNKPDLEMHNQLFRKVESLLRLRFQKGTNPDMRFDKLPIGRWGCAGYLITPDGKFTNKQLLTTYVELTPSFEQLLQFEYDFVMEAAELLKIGGTNYALSYMTRDCEFTHAEAVGVLDIAARTFHNARIQDNEVARSLHIARIQDLADRCRANDDRRIELAALRTEAELLGLTKGQSIESQDELLEAAILSSEEGREKLLKEEEAT